MKKLLSLFTKNVANPAEGLANTALSLIKDKVRDSDTSFIRETVRRGVSISSKRVLNFTGTGAILTIALFLIQKNGLDKWTLALVGIGVLYSLGMSFITSWKEKD
ncbi:hypothetical protein LCGC14_0463600 [marine sediment metagenome]|uniref:Uncharacterized protein n=1 Tax=marine sediment metagenome TaxID=412755 RepID=A0A0F9SX19_9ZZZZ